MTPKYRSVNLLAITAALAAVILWTSWPTKYVHAIQDSETPSASFGLAQGQTARLNIVNCGDDQGFIIDGRFVDKLNRVVARTPEPHLVPPGTITSIDVNGDTLEVTRDALGRIQMRAVVTSLGGPDTFERFGQVSVEVIDNATGRSQLFIPAASAKGCSNDL